ncbi:MAG: tetratricopeptide repeat protein [Pyrinomonadaceae bacterium]
MPEDEAIAKARQMANKALELDPRSSEALTALGLVALYDKSPEEAGSLYRRAIEIKPNNTAARLRLAVMLTLNDTLDDAISELRLAQKADPTSMVANQTLTRLLRLNRDPDGALIFCKKALEIDPDSAAARSYLAEIYEQKDNLDKAAAELDGLLKEAPDDPEFNLLRSRVAAKKGNDALAREFLQKGIKNRKPDEFSYELSTAYLFLNEKAKALEVLKTAKENTLIYFIHLKFDSNLDEIRKEKDFASILEAAKLRLDPSYK